MSHFVVYLKAEQSVCINHRKMLIKDIAKVYCSDPEMTKTIENIRLFTFPNEKSGREAISIMKIIQEIKTIYKEAEVCNLGEQDILVYYKMPEKKKKWPEKLTVAAIGLTVFFGAGVSIMGYNNDVDVIEVFSKIYLTTMGVEGPEANFMHFFYAIGLLVGMIIFFNHASRKRLSDEPTPVEVQMRQYEKNVNTAIITGSGRKEEELDVDS